MVRIFTTFLISFIVAGTLRAQTQATAVPSNVRAANLIQQLSGGIQANGASYGLPLPPGKVIGDTYLNAKWQLGTIFDKNGDKVVEGYPLRLDLQTNEIEIYSPNGIRVVNGKGVSSFTWIDSLRVRQQFYVNARSYVQEDNKPCYGFFEVLSDGQHPLLKMTFWYIKKANYNVQLDVGTRDDQIERKETYYLAEGNTVKELPSSKKKFFTVFGAKAEAVQKYARENSLKFSNERDLIQIFNYFNGL